MARVVKDFTVLPATHAFIRKRYEPCLYLPQPKLVFILPTPERRKAESTLSAGYISYLDGLPVRRRSPIKVLVGPEVD